MLVDDEARKYERVWTDPKYRRQHDGKPAIEIAFRKMGCRPGESLIDWGCGSGVASAIFQELGLWVTGFDIASNCLNEGINVLLVVGTMWEPPSGLVADYAFCTDVLEHIPPEHVGAAMDTISKRTRKAAYIQVDTALDISGPRMKPPERLHLTVQPHEWWGRELLERFYVVIPHPATFTRAAFLCFYPKFHEDHADLPSRE